MNLLSPSLVISTPALARNICTSALVFSQLICSDVQSKTSLDNFLHSVQVHPERREGAYPYYLLHNAGDNVYGTVLIFHGLTSKPDQCWRLAQYLFDTGFNVYQPCIAAHYLINPDKNWPQVDLKPQWKQPIREKFLADPVLSQALNAVDTVNNVTQEQLNFVMQRVNELSPDMADIISAINVGDYSEKFQRFYESSHLRYLQESESRLEEVQSLPGPIFTIGLSVGGAVALGLAAAHPDKISKVVAYAPLLRELNEVKRQFSLKAGPLDVKETGWDPRLQFTLGCFAATDVFKNHVNHDGNIDTLAHIPTFVALTENDDSADIPTNQQFNARLIARAGRSGTPHLESMYTSSEHVPHPIYDPIEARHCYNVDLSLLPDPDIVINKINTKTCPQSLLTSRTQNYPSYKQEVKKKEQ
ncbi:hypothetical protein O6H91_05G047700 [Diphasiastrum complanatum]|uniref:Uncharacterized protein n=1 Tax=Diphasiastrum complanatum TaxID=34168 RepID=A0ACC2DN40_DIPCM|nr:hypothetical protein O6H91_05G047700 [Diphasiastrum complanatum]